ncbi:MAG: transferase hexapeptide repeat family protein [Saprospiraceae bacterium]|nr:transferase hexapeptide repeat family protein [Saprospiraceae bacterium]
MIYRFKEFIPVIDSTAFVHPLACVTGCVSIGKNVYVGPFAVLRGDFGEIIIEEGCNIQEHCLIHMFPGITVHLRRNVHVGHGAIIHGCEIGENCLIGMNSVVMDDVIIGKECIVGALSFIKEGSVFEDRSLIVGNPAKKIREVLDEMIDWKTKGTELYMQLSRECHEHLEEVMPLREMVMNRKTPNQNYASWKRNQKDLK